jgi:superoxide oxidase
MTKTNYSVRYNKSIVILHWLMLLLMIAVYSFIELRVLFAKGTEPRELMKTVHYMLGLTVLASVIVRIYFRASSTAPVIEPELSKLAKYVSKVMHIVLYALMIGMPIAGWLMLSAAGKVIPFFGLELPPLIAENKDLADTIKGIHKTAGNTGYFLIAGHALAGLYHHYVKRDNVLKRMQLGKPSEQS